MSIHNDKLVKITATGKVSVMLSRGLKMSLLNLLQVFINTLRDERRQRGNLTVMKVDTHISLAVIEEMFVKYHTQLHLIDRECRLPLSMAQALVFWSMCQCNDHLWNDDAEMGNLLMELHRKLSHP